MHWLSGIRALTLLLTFVLAACGTAGPAGGGTSSTNPSGAASAPRKITVAMRGEAKTISAKLNSEAGAGGTPGVGEVEDLLNAEMAMLDDDRVLHPQLAEAVPTTENGQWKVFPDGRMETTWRLRQGVTWHDGAPFTADDLVFTARVESDKDLPVFRNVAHDHIASFEAPDPYTFKVNWTRPFIEADSRMPKPMPKHLLEKTYLEDKENLPQLTYWNRDFIGTGPFKLKDWATGSHLILERHAAYILGTPKLSEIEVRFIPDPSALAANILAGGIDLTIGGRLSLEWGVQVRDQWRDGKMVVTNPTSAISAYPQFINPSSPVQLQADFRRALLSAIDRQEIIDSLTYGLAPLADSIISPRDAEFADVQSSIVKYPYDPRRAAQLIEGLGFTKGSDGFYRGPGGEILTAPTQTQATDDQQVKTQLSLANYWEKVGVKVDQVSFPSQRAQDREFRATRPGFEIVRQPGGVTNLQRFHGAQTPLPENNFTGQNRTRHRSAEFDALIDRTLTTIPRAERMGYLNQIVRYMTDQVVLVGLFWDPGPTLMSNRLRNTESGDPYNGHEWDVAT
jgi:peptide/nickel transport system substrate-binding protein